MKEEKEEPEKKPGLEANEEKKPKPEEKDYKKTEEEKEVEIGVLEKLVEEAKNPDEKVYPVDPCQ